MSGVRVTITVQHTSKADALAEIEGIVQKIREGRPGGHAIFDADRSHWYWYEADDPADQADTIRVQRAEAALRDLDPDEGTWPTGEQIEAILESAGIL